MTSYTSLKPALVATLLVESADQYYFAKQRFIEASDFYRICQGEVFIVRLSNSFSLAGVTETTITESCNLTARRSDFGPAFGSDFGRSRHSFAGKQIG
jgi:hypothetical protein